MTDDWCPENDGAYRAELAAMHRFYERRKCRADLIDMDVLRRVKDAMSEVQRAYLLPPRFQEPFNKALSDLSAMMEKMK